MTLEEALNLAVRHHQAGRLAEAAAIYRQIVAEHPALYEGHRHLGLALQAQGNLDEAIEAFRQAALLRGDLADAHNNLAQAYYAKGEFGEAIPPFQRAAELDGEAPGYLANLGNAYHKTARFAAAIECYQKALGVDPDFAVAHWNLGLLLLLQGDYRRGWAEFEWRWRVTGLDHPRLTFAPPIWNGGPLEGRRILLHAEQGMGDAIQFIRYVPRVVQRGGHVTVACQRPLAPLLRGVPGIAEVVALDEALPPFDVHCPLLSLHRAFLITPGNIPGEPYLKARADRGAHFRAKMPAGAGLKVGLVWANKPNPPDRSPAAAALAPLAAIPSVRFFSLQKWRSDMTPTTPPLDLIDWTQELNDLADTAALIDHLDLVITVDTAVAHVAGAMGKPAWVMLKFVPDWRWMLDRADSPWYPSLRLFRQPRLGDWSAVISAVGSALRTFAALGSARRTLP